MPEAPEASPGSTARRHFHWCLAAAILPVVSLPFEWFVAYRDQRAADTTPDHRRWARWLIGLAAVDTIVAALVIALVASGVWGAHTLTQSRSRPRSGEAVRIGVTIATNPETAGVQISLVGIESPAERAGIRPGDVVLSVDETTVRTGDDLARLVRSSTPGVPRAIRISRAGNEMVISVTPELRPATREPTRALLDASPSPSCLADAVGYTRVLAGWRGLWAGGILIVLFWLVWRRAQPHAPPFWSWVVAVLGSMVLIGPLAFWGVCLGVGGRSVAGPLVATLAQTIAALVVALIAMRYMAGQGLLGARLEPILKAPRAILLGFFYLIAANIRLSVVSSALEAVMHARWPALDADMTVASSASAFGWSGAALLAVTIILIAPLEEEVLFRGVILPRLTPWLGARWAIVATAVIFAVLHEGFGREPMGLRPAGVFLIALALGWARLRTAGLTAPIAMHVMTNAILSFAPR